jgi:hypothetical protein
MGWLLLQGTRAAMVLVLHKLGQHHAILTKQTNKHCFNIIFRTQSQLQNATVLQSHLHDPQSPCPQHLMIYRQQVTAHKYQFHFSSIQVHVVFFLNIITHTHMLQFNTTWQIALPSGAAI